MSSKNSAQLPANAVQEDDTIVIPVIEIFRQLKKYLFLWIILIVVAAALVFGGSLALSSSHATPLTALVGFSYQGIEEGLDPNGNDFDPDSIKSPAVLEKTITELGMEMTQLETIRSSITISGVVPEDTVDELTAYKSIFEDNSSMEAAKKIMEVSYQPTQFKIEFTYIDSDMTRSEGAEFLNTLLDNYKVYFMQNFGYNDALGSAITAVDYAQYDYPQALDIFTSTLSTLQSYVSQLSNQDNTRFRSTETGYTFADLQESISTLRNVDLKSTSSYVYSKNVTKDKDSLMIYYQYQIDESTRSMTNAQEQMTELNKSIDNYQKDSIVIMAGNDTTPSAPLFETSQAYDDLITQKTEKQASISSYQQQINSYNSRMDNLKKKALGSNKDKEKVEADMAALSEKINQMVDTVNKTSDEFFETASYSNAYNVLVPASGSVSSVIKVAINNMMRPLLIAEALLFVIYLVFAVVRAFQISLKQNTRIKESTAEAEE